jgi:hypothetical protein
MALRSWPFYQRQKATIQRPRFQRGSVSRGSGYSGGGKIITSVEQAAFVIECEGCVVSMAVSHAAADAIIERVEIFNAQSTAGIKLKPLGIYRSAHADSARTKRGRTFIDKEAKNIAELTEDVIFRLMIKYKCDVHTGKYGKPDISLEAAVYERAMNSKSTGHGLHTPHPKSKRKRTNKRSQSTTRMVKSSRLMKNRSQPSSRKSTCLPSSLLSCKIPLIPCLRVSAFGLQTSLSNLLIPTLALLLLQRP